MKKNTLVLISLLILLTTHKNYSQSDTLLYKIGIGLSALDFWDSGLQAYGYNLDKNISNDPFDTGVPFINHFTMSLQISNKNRFGRISYLVTNNWRRSKRINMLSLSYGITKPYFKEKIFLSSEVGLGYGIIFDSENQTSGKNIFGMLGGCLNIPIWNGINIQNRLNTIFSSSSKKFYLNHTFSIAYEF